ncbi:beta-glucosidase family protein [Niabella aquatica]
MSVALKSYTQFNIPDTRVMQQANKLLVRMTLEEKLLFITGGPKATINGIPRLGLRPIRMSDGPLGIKAQAEGEDAVKINATAFPSAMTMASTWNNHLLYEIGKAIGSESKYNGVDILLGPSVNMVRIPQNGRNFEYFGEDPYLTGQLGVAYIKGLQSQKVLANVKHFAANNSEFNRYKSNSVLDERTLHEIYLPAFEAAVKEGGSATVMTAHNLLNGYHSSENAFLLDTILRKNWNFNGFVISDWFSNYDLIPTARYGVDLEMPIPRIMMQEQMLKALKNKEISVEDIDKKVRRILYTCLYFNLYEQQNAQAPDLGQHASIALRTGEEGTVLLKNSDNFLPLAKKNIKNIVLLGRATVETPSYGGGAAGMDARRKRNMLHEIQHLAGNNINVSYFENTDVNGVAEKLKTADIVLISVGFDAKTEGEAHDRPFSLPEDQNKLIQQVAAINPNIVVVLYAGGSVNISPWINEVKALFMPWYLGDATGHIIGRIIFGEINPSGKLPISIEKDWKDSPAFKSYDTYASEANMPALFKPFYEKINGVVDSKSKIDTPYEEGIFMGYRHYTTSQIEPLFPFGFGLSYTSFNITDLRTSFKNGNIMVMLNVKNTGKIAGAEVVQIYVGDDEASIKRPVKELKAYEKIFLKPGEQRQLTFCLTKKDLSFWDINTHSWKAETGYFTIYAASSSADSSNQTKVLWKE